MKYLWRFMQLVTCCLLLVGCGIRSKYVDVNKEGTQYTIDNVRFYYPDRFTLDNKKTNPTSIQFHDQSESIFYEVYENDTVNELEHRITLYTAELKQKEASNIVVSQPILKSGLTVYEITGSYINQEMRFKHIVYFTDRYTYIFGYKAIAKDYEANSNEITTFLQSIVIEEIHE